MRHNRFTALCVLSAALAVLAWGFSSCAGLGTDKSPLVFETTVASEGDGIVRWDGNTGLAHADGQLTVRVLDKATRFPLVLYQVTEGKTLLWSKTRNYSEELIEGEPLPHWILETGIFADEAEANALGFTVHPVLLP